MKKYFIIVCTLSISAAALIMPITANAEISNGMPASEVYGQTDAGVPSFTQGQANNGGSTSASGLNEPYGVTLDPYGHRLFVAEQANNRVLVYNLTNDNKQQDTDASYVLGQANFSDSAEHGGSTGLASPTGAAYDHGRQLLYVADQNHFRVMVFDVASITNGEAAVNVIGEPDFDTVVSANTANVTNAPLSVAIDTTRQRLYVAEVNGNRVGVYDVDTITNGEDNIAVLGQATVTADAGNVMNVSTMYRPTGVAIDMQHQKLYVAVLYQFRVLVFDVSTVTTGEDAINVLGSSSFDDISAVAATGGLPYPHQIAFDAARNQLFVSLPFYNNILVFDTTEIVNGEGAIYILGQSDFFLSGHATTTEGMSGCIGMVLDPTNGALFVGDAGNNRVTYYSGVTDVDTTTDRDNDGVLDTVENAAPNNGDANADGVPDADQVNVTSFVDSSGKYVSIANASTERSMRQIFDTSSTSQGPAVQQLTVASRFISFSLRSGVTSDDITIFFYDETNPNFVLRKYSTTSDVLSSVDGSSTVRTTIAGHSVIKATYTLVDNGPLDTDSTVGTIADPVGLVEFIGAPRTGLGGTA